MTIVLTLDAILARHVPATAYGHERPICTYCEQDWPCEVAVVGAALARSAAVVAAAETYALACAAVDAVYGSEADDWGDRMGDAMHARQEASDALYAAIAARQPVAPRIGKTARQYAQERSARDPEFAAALAALRQPVAPDPPGAAGA